MPALTRLAGKRVRSSECLINNETVSMFRRSARSEKGDGGSTGGWVADAATLRGGAGVGAAAVRTPDLRIGNAKRSQVGCCPVARLATVRSCALLRRLASPTGPQRCRGPGWRLAFVCYSLVSQRPDVPTSDARAGSGGPGRSAIASAPNRDRLQAWEGWETIDPGEAHFDIGGGRVDDSISRRLRRSARQAARERRRGGRGPGADA